MYLKICEHLDIQITYKILWLEFHEHSFFQDFQLAFKEGYFFLAIFMKNMVDSLGVNLQSFCLFGYSS